MKWRGLSFLSSKHDQHFITFDLFFFQVAKVWYPHFYWGILCMPLNSFSRVDHGYEIPSGWKRYAGY